MAGVATPTRLLRGRQPIRRASGAAESAKSMKRTRSQADLESEESESSSDAKDDSSADQDFVFKGAPAAKKRKQAGGRAVKIAPATQAASKNAATKKPSRTRNTPQTSTKSAKATTSATSTSTPQTGRNGDLSSAVQDKARLPQCNLGAVEFLTFFPLHIRWPELGLRLYCNGWKSETIAKAQLHARNKLDYRSNHAVDKRRSSNRHQVISNGAFFHGQPTFAPQTHPHLLKPVTTYDATNYAPRKVVSTMFDAKLVDIAKGVVNWPKNEDRGVVTQAIEYAVQNDRQDLTTAHIPQLVAQLGLQEPSDAFSTEWDQRGLERSEARIELTGNYRVWKFNKPTGKYGWVRFSKAYEGGTESETQSETESQTESETEDSFK